MVSHIQNVGAIPVDPGGQPWGSGRGPLEKYVRKSERISPNSLALL